MAWADEAEAWVDGILNGDSNQTYNVSRGDTVEAIARATYGENWRAGVAAIIDANGIQYNHLGSPLIYAGSDITLPTLNGQDVGTLSSAGGSIIDNNSRGLAAAAQLAAEAPVDWGAYEGFVGIQRQSGARPIQPLSA